MERTTISLPEELLKRLKLIAAERRTSMAALVREALEEKAGTHRPKPRSLGIGDSGHTDTSMLTTTERLSLEVGASGGYRPPVRFPRPTRCQTRRVSPPP